jgi:hypothetical protein
MSNSHVKTKIMTRDYIPASNSGFMSFQGNLDKQVTINARAWNIPATQATVLTTWSTDYEPFFHSISNKRTRTVEQVIAHDAYRAAYVDFLRPFCQGFLVNNPIIPISQRAALGLNPRGLNPRSTRPTIISAPIPSLVPIGGGMVKFSFKVADSVKRTARHPESNGIEVHHKIESQALQPQPLNDLLIEEGGAAEPPEDKAVYENSFKTRANFTKKLGRDNIGKRLTVYAR